MQSASAPHFLRFSIRKKSFSTQFSTELLKTFTSHSSFALLLRERMARKLLPQKIPAQRYDASRNIKLRLRSLLGPHIHFRNRLVLSSSKGVPPALLTSRHSLQTPQPLSVGASLQWHRQECLCAVINCKPTTTPQRINRSRLLQAIAKPTPKIFHHASRDIISPPRRHPTHR